MPRLITSIGRAAKKVVRSAISKDLPNGMKSILEKDGDVPISKIDVGRSPILSVIKKLIDVIGNQPFDKLFHLYLIIKLSNGHEYKFEKNETLNLTSNIGNLSEAEIINVPINKDITMNELFNKIINRVGIKGFITYDASSNNCQSNIYNTLSASGLMNNELKGFIKQDTDKLLSPIVAGLARGATDIAAGISGLMGKGKKLTF